MYDASKAMFEDILGFPNIQKLQQGKVEYVSSPVTVWDKEMVLIDEINRTMPETQSKWLTLIRSREIMGFPTDVKWVWAAMNPMSYAGTQQLDEALVGRFALFLYPPDVMQMDEADRIRVATHINGDDAPALELWCERSPESRYSPVSARSSLRLVQSPFSSMADVEMIGEQLRDMLRIAGGHFLRLREEMETLPEFLAKFSDLLMRESNGEVKLDGRRLGFIHRNIIANRAVEIAKAEATHSPVPDFVESARYVVQSSIPVELNDEGINREEAIHKMEICFDLLSSYFAKDAELHRVNLIYELFTCSDLMRRAELMLTHDLGEMALSKAWTDLMNEDRDITLLAYTALQIEARRPGTVPQELLASLAGKVSGEKLSTKCIGRIEGDAVEYIDEIEEMLERESDIEKLVAYERVSELIESKVINPDTLEKARRSIEEDTRRFEALLGDVPNMKGVVAA